MGEGGLRAAVSTWLAGQGFAEPQVSSRGNLMRAQGDAAGWVIGLCDDKESPRGYLFAFDGVMDILIRESTSAAPGTNLAAAVAYGSTLRGEELSYRKALKKYSSSIIFLDLGFHLLLVGDDGGLEVVPPVEVNTFLRNLNRHIIAAKSK